MTTSAGEVFRLVRSALEASGIRFAVGGSWASAAYGEARFTYDIDILADFDANSLERFLRELPAGFHADAEEARHLFRMGRAFNVIYMPTALKFDLFPAKAFPIGAEEIERAVMLPNSGLGEDPVPFVSPEDILLAKLDWFRQGGEVSERQWRDIVGIVRTRFGSLDRSYLKRSAERLGVAKLLELALAATA
jgi:hypothetical protein